MSPVVVFLFIAFIVFFVRKQHKLFLLGCKLPGPWALPLVGNIQQIPKLQPQYILETFVEYRKKYRKTFRMWLGPQLWVFLHSPKETRDALNDPTLIKAETFNQLSALIGNGLLLSHGKYWERQRRALGSAFYPQVLNGFSHTIAEHARQLSQILASMETKSIEITEYLFPCVLDSIVETSMGKKLDSLTDPTCKYNHAFHSASELLFKRMVQPLYAPDIIFKLTRMYRQLNQALEVIHTLAEEMIMERREFLSLHPSQIFTTSSRNRLTLLDTLLTSQINGESMTSREIRDEVNTFVFAGVDTTTAAMSFVLYALAKYPEEQLKLYESIKDVTIGDDFAKEEMNTLEYLDIFIKEVLRFYTIVPVTGRKTTRPTKIGDIEYCAGVNIWVNMYGLAHDDEFFEEPERFWPERFSKDQQQNLPPYTYIPFSGGPHICIGRRYAILIMKILTIEILQNFEVTLSNPNEELILMAQMVLKSMNGINLKFKKRVV